MHVLRSKKFLVLLAAVVSAGAVVAVALPAVVFRQVYAEGTNLKYHFVRAASDAGGMDSGWHIHPGLVIFQLEAGSVQIYQGSCTPRTLAPGDTFIEVPWKPVRAVAQGNAVWTVSAFVPANEELHDSAHQVQPAAGEPVSVRRPKG